MSCSATTEMSSGTDSPWLRTAAIAPTAATALAATSAVGRGRQLQQPGGRGCAAHLVERGLGDVPLGDVQPGLGHRVDVTAAAALRSVDVLRARDVGDPGVPDRDQVSRAHGDAGLVVDDHARSLGCTAAVNQHRRRRAGRVERGHAVCGGDAVEDPVDPVLEDLLPQMGAAAGDQQHVAGRGGPLFGADGDLRVDHVAEIGDDQPQRHRPGGLQRRAAGLRR